MYPCTTGEQVPPLLLSSLAPSSSSISTAFPSGQTRADSWLRNGLGEQLVPSHLRRDERAVITRKPSSTAGLPPRLRVLYPVLLIIPPVSRLPPLLCLTRGGHPLHLVGSEGIPSPRQSLLFRSRPRRVSRCRPGTLIRGLVPPHRPALTAFFLAVGSSLGIQSIVRRLPRGVGPR